MTVVWFYTTPKAQGQEPSRANTTILGPSFVIVYKLLPAFPACIAHLHIISGRFPQLAVSCAKLQQNKTTNHFTSDMVGQHVDGQWVPHADTDQLQDEEVP